MPSNDPAERKLIAAKANAVSWANTADPQARTAAARRAHADRFTKQARQLHPDAPDDVIDRVAGALKRAFYADLALKSVRARKLKAQLAVLEAEIEAEKEAS
jgi:hypothetical protein